MGDRMGSRKRMNVEEDRLSSLPDDLIHKIMSFVSIKRVVQTSVLSPRWRYIWTSTPYLNFSSNDFHTSLRFSDFVEHVLSRRNNKIEVVSVWLTFRGRISQAFVKRILKYAFSHNIQQLNITCLSSKKIDSLLSLLSSWSLKRLNIVITSTGCTKLSNTTRPTWHLPALTTLYLHSVSLYDNNIDKCASLFSNLPNLKNLTLKSCTMIGLNTSNFNVCHPGVSSLTLERCYNDVNVDTPQLKNLIIKGWKDGIRLISAPKLSSLHYSNYYYPLELSVDLLNLENVDICISYPSIDKENAHKFVSLLQQLHSVKVLTLNLELIEFLSSSGELISHQTSPFTDLKSLKIYPTNVIPVEGTQQKVTMSSEVKRYLLGGSTGATFTMVSHEEISVVKNVTSARNRMLELQVLLDKCKEQDKALMQSQVRTLRGRDTEMKSHFHVRMTRIERFWEDLNKPFQRGYYDTRRIVSLLREIEGILIRVPRSHGAKLQTKFYGLRAEAESLMKKMMDEMKIQCDKNPNFLP